VRIEEPHQIATFADFCNDCGNCDVFCPEDGGPYLVKPRLFGSLASWSASPPLDGFFVERRDGVDAVFARFGGSEYRMLRCTDRIDYSGAGFAVSFSQDDPEGTLAGDATAVVDLTFFRIMDALRAAILASSAVNYVNSM
jgi:putative selenate reductase